jgi:membrane-bound serine protease (ClpP class)
MNQLKRALIFSLLFLMVLVAVPVVASAAQDSQTTIYAISIDGEITPAMSAFLMNRLDHANKEGAIGVIIEIRTLGGRVDSAIEMRDAIIASGIPVVAYIESRAISAGALISIAADTIIMAPGSHIGAAEPVPNEPKALAFVSGEFRSTAERAGRDPEIAMAMVDITVEIEGLIGADAILDMTANQALQYGYADHIVSGRSEVLRVMGWSNAQVIEEKPDFRYRIAQFLTSYEIASLLLLLGMLGIAAELFSPGFGAPGIVGIISFALYFAGGFLAGNTEWWAAVIFLAGIILIIIEIIVPGFGIFGIGGIVALFAGIILAAPSLKQGVIMLTIAMAATLIAIPVFFKIFGRSRLIQRFVLATAETVEMGYTHTVAKKDDLIGKTGKTMTVFRPAGSVMIDGERVDAIADGSFIDQDQLVKVIKVSGTKVIVSTYFDADQDV